MRNRNEKLSRMVLGAMFAAIVVVMTVVPYTGYITHFGISITTLHIPVILCAVMLGWKYGALIGGVWGVSCLVKAFVEPIPVNVPFQNPVISVVPRILVGLAAAGLFWLFTEKIRLKPWIAAVIAAAGGTLTNTVLVLGALAAFGYFGDTTIAATFKLIVETLIAVNGVIEMLAALTIVPALYLAVQKYSKSRHSSVNVK